MDIKQDIKSAKRIVIKVGTSTLTYDTGKLNLKRLDTLARIISDLHNSGREIILVSSGAIGVGAGKLGLAGKSEDTKVNQAIAAVGQCELMFLYDKLFSEYNNTVAQILLTKEDIAVPKRKRNMMNTMNTLLEMGIIPIVNENDTVAVDEIEIGDNDTLSAVVADFIDADLLILFSDIDGLYSGDPHVSDSVELISVVPDISKVRRLAGGAGTRRGTGGMVTKLDAAEIATNAGINMIIANGENIENIYGILDGEQVGTLFLSKNYRGGSE